MYTSRSNTTTGQTVAEAYEVILIEDILLFFDFVVHAFFKNKFLDIFV